MYLSTKARMQRLMRNGRCLSVAIDHGISNEPSDLAGLEDMDLVSRRLISAGPDAIQLNHGQADLLQSDGDKSRPVLILRADLGNAHNAASHREMWTVLQNAHDPVLPAVQLDAACLTVNLYMIPDEPGIFRQSVQNIAALRGDCDKYGMPLMIEPLVLMPARNGRGGYDLDGDTDKIVSLVRLAREMGADIIKTDAPSDAEEFYKVVEAARCPVLVRGSGLPGDFGAFLTRVAELLQHGASGLAYSRGVHAEVGAAELVATLMAMVHDGLDVEQALLRHHPALVGGDRLAPVEAVV